MISVVIPTLNAEGSLAECLSSLVPAVVDGVVKEVIIVDGGSQDRTLRIADDSGARVVEAEKGRGLQLCEGGRQACGLWLLFLHADTVLDPGWWLVAQKFIDQVAAGRRPDCAAAFRYALDDEGIWPRTLEVLVGLRTRLLAVPYGDQGLLISRKLYDEVGGYRALKIMEDVDIVRRIGRRRLTVLNARAVTSAVRYRDEGYLHRIMRNQTCMALYLCGVSEDRIARYYGFD